MRTKYSTEYSLQSLHFVASDFTGKYAPSVADVSREIQSNLRVVRRYIRDIISHKNDDYNKICDLVSKIKGLNYAETPETKSYRDAIFDLIKDDKHLRKSYLNMISDEVRRLFEEMKRIEKMEHKLNKYELKLEKLPKPKSRIRLRRLTLEEKVERVERSILESEIRQLQSEINAQNRTYEECQTQLCRIMYNSDHRPEFDLGSNKEIIAAFSEQIIENLNDARQESEIDEDIGEVVIDTQANYQQRSALLHSDIRELESELDDLDKQVDNFQGEVKEKVIKKLSNCRECVEKVRTLLSTKNQSLESKQESLERHKDDALEGFINLCVKDDQVFQHYLQDRTMRSIYYKPEEVMKEEGFDCTSFYHDLKVMGGETRRAVPLLHLFPDFCELIKTNKDKIIKEVNERVSNQPATSVTPLVNQETRAVVQTLRSDSWGESSSKH